MWYILWNVSNAAIVGVASYNKHKLKKPNEREGKTLAPQSPISSGKESDDAS